MGRKYQLWRGRSISLYFALRKLLLEGCVDESILAFVFLPGLLSTVRVANKLQDLGSRVREASTTCYYIAATNASVFYPKLTSCGWTRPTPILYIDAAGLQTYGYAAICGAPFNEVCVKGYRRDFLLIFVSGITEGSAVLLLSIQIFNVISWNAVCLTQSLRILCWAPRGAIMQPLPFALPPTNNIYPAAQPS